MVLFRDVIQQIRERVNRYQGTQRINEENTKATLVEPVLRALGWDLEDLDVIGRIKTSHLGSL